MNYVAIGLEVAGVALLVTAAALVSYVLALAVLGALLVLIGAALGRSQERNK